MKYRYIASLYIRQMMNDLRVCSQYANGGKPSAKSIGSHDAECQSNDDDVDEDSNNNASDSSSSSSTVSTTDEHDNDHTKYHDHYHIRGFDGHEETLLATQDSSFYRVPCRLFYYP